MNDLGEKLKDLRKARSITQDVLAEYLNVSRGSISNWEKGKRTPDLKTLEAIAQFYNIGLDYFGQINDKDELLDLLTRARNIFESDSVSIEDKDTLYHNLMRIYLKIK